ncbi:MAG: hypothetical protein CFE45_05510, partial [Burkholderiales bacterium PBB5]
MSRPCTPATAARCPQPARIGLNAAGLLEEVNAQAQWLLNQHPHLIRIQDRRLTVPDAAGLQQCLQRAGAGQLAALSLRRPGRLPLTLLAEPCPGAPAGAVQITLRDPESERPAQPLLRELFALTPVEAQVTALLAEGCRTSDIAEALGVQANTVQAHLKSVSSKTGCRHQAALLSLVLRRVAMHPVAT